ncbi:PASTA domain-containing protein [Streptomyces sp. NPDC088752]|uniref:PASTA domain-containing protein n=1 Tax=Streptomyces sp. NPDC088752 TaxID=3154963 RepID=UPI0034128AAE
MNDRLGGVALLIALFLLWRRNPWPRSGRVVASFVAMALFGAVLPEQPADSPAQAANAGAAKPPARPSRFPTASQTTAEATMPAVPDFTGDSLDVAFPKSRRKGFTVIYHDASDQRREVRARSLWKVCFQVTGGSPGEPIVDFGVVRREEPCPEAEGKTVPWRKMPDVMGLTWRAAVPKVTAAGVPESDVHAEAAYLNDTLPREGEYDHWRVCRQDPASGVPLTDEVYLVRLALSSSDHGCPDPDRGGDAYLPDRDDDGDPDYLDPHPHDRNRTRLYPNGIPGGTGSTGSSGGSGDGWHICRHTRWC